MPNLRTIIAVRTSAICGFSPCSGVEGVGSLADDGIYGAIRLDDANPKGWCNRWICSVKSARHNVHAPPERVKLGMILRVPSFSKHKLQNITRSRV
jgi:hypothetical protein